MIDLTSPEMQSTFKKLERTTLVTNVTMCIVTLLAAAIAIWGSSTTKGDSSWSEILFYVLIAVLAAYFVVLLVWEIYLRYKNSKAMHAFVAEGFYACDGLLSGEGKFEFETALAGDKLVVMRADSGKYVEFDLAPVRNYSSVCAYAVRLAKRFVRDYYFVAAKKGGVESVVLTDKVQGRGRTHAYVENGKPKLAFLSELSPFIQRGLIKD